MRSCAIRGWGRSLLPAATAGPDVRPLPRRGRRELLGARAERPVGSGSAASASSPPARSSTPRRSACARSARRSWPASRSACPTSAPRSWRRSARGRSAGTRSWSPSPGGSPAWTRRSPARSWTRAFAEELAESIRLFALNAILAAHRLADSAAIGAVAELLQTRLGRGRAGPARARRRDRAGRRRRHAEARFAVASAELLAGTPEAGEALPRSRPKPSTGTRGRAGRRARRPRPTAVADGRQPLQDDPLPRAAGPDRGGAGRRTRDTCSRSSRRSAARSGSRDRAARVRGRSHRVKPDASPLEPRLGLRTRRARRR